MAYTTVGSPFRYRVRLSRLAGKGRRTDCVVALFFALCTSGEAERAGQLMETRIQKLKEALRSAESPLVRGRRIEDESRSKDAQECRRRVRG